MQISLKKYQIFSTYLRVIMLVSAFWFFGGILTANAYESPNSDLFSWFGDGVTGGYIWCDGTVLSPSDLTECNDILVNFVGKSFLYATSTTGDNDTATGAGSPFPITGSIESPLGNQINLADVGGYPVTASAYTNFYVLGDGEENVVPPVATTSTTTVNVDTRGLTAGFFTLLWVSIFIITIFGISKFT